MKVVGIRRIDISNANGEYHGYKYYCTEKDQNVAGVLTDTFTLSDRFLSSMDREICLEDEVIPVYKRDSKVIRSVIFDN